MIIEGNTADSDCGAQGEFVSFWRLVLMKKFKYVLLLIAGLMLLCGCSVGRKNISMSPYIMTNVSGLSGRATATIYLDTKGIYNALAGADASDADKAKYDTFVSSLGLTCDKVDKIANGDTLNVTVTYDEAVADQLKIDVNDFVKKVDVAGLEVGQEIDVFKDLKVEVTGTAPYAFVTYTNNSSDPYIKNLEYAIEGKTSGLKNGDIITIRCKIDAKAAEQYHYYTDVTSMSYTVEGLDSYIYDSSQLDYAQLNDIAAECADEIRKATDDTTTRMLYKLTENTDYLYQDNNEWIDSMKLGKVIFMSGRGDGSSKYENILLYVYEVVIANNFYAEKGYFLFEYTNAITNGNGEFMVGRNNPELRYVCGLDYDTLFNEIMQNTEVQYSSEILDGIILEENAQ